MHAQPASTPSLLAPTPLRFDPRRALAAAWTANRPLTLTGALMLATLAATLVGLLVDPRVVTGAPVWLKPAKFAVSIAIYSFTLVWLLGFVGGHRRLVATIAWGTAVALLVEQVIIAGQALRGTTSHYNTTTALDAALWSTMGASIVVVWVLNLLTAVLLLRRRLPEPAFAWGLRLGVLVSFVGMGLAFVMAESGAHSVGVPDGGAGLPIVGWSTEGGDLRVSHFVGMHALQVLPLVGWLLARPALSRLGEARRVALVWTAGLFSLGLVVLLFWQALRGEPLTSPTAPTLAAFGGLLGAAALAAGITVLSARPAPAPGSILTS